MAALEGEKRVKSVDLTGKPFHFIGIGGIGMSALAYILAQRNLPVSGSDLRSTHITERLNSVGAKIFQAQVASNLEFFHTQENLSRDLPQVVCSTAINQNNLELAAALAKGCDIFHRSDLLAALIKDYRGIGVAGTHGKTTTSSMIGYLLLEAGLDPTIIVGGEVDAWEGNARLGQGEYLIAEADESDGSLIKHFPEIGIITNIELDHPDHYADIEDVIEIFSTFSQQCKTVIGSIDDVIVQNRIQPDITYSLDSNSQADYIASNIQYNTQGIEAEIWERGKLLGSVQLKLFGKHNISNALAAIAVGRCIGLEFAQITPGISKFTGSKRRFEILGNCQNITFVDDYAHHPTEITATLEAARQKIQENPTHTRVVAIFQPHRYSRAYNFRQEFSKAFSQADEVVVTDIYSAGEKNLWQITGEQIAARIRQYHPHVHYHADLNSLSQFLVDSVLQPGDLAIFLGAGNLNQTIPSTINLYQNRP